MTERSSTLIEESGQRAPMYTVEVSGISEQQLRRLDELARERGSNRSQVIRDILARELDGDPADMAIQSFDAALAPLRAGFAESGMSEEEAEALLDEGLRAVRAERRQTKNRATGEAKRVSDDR